MAAYEGTNDEWREAIWGHAARRTRLKNDRVKCQKCPHKKNKKTTTRKQGRGDAVVIREDPQSHNKQFGFQPNNVHHITTGMLEVPQCFLPVNNV